MPVFTGTTVEAAITAGLHQLGLTRSQVNIVVIAKEKKGFLGFGKRLAQVELSPLASASAVPQEATQSELLTVAREVPAQPESVSATEAAVDTSTPLEVTSASPETYPQVAENKEPRYDLEAISQDVLSYVEAIIYEMDVEATIIPTTSRRHMTFQIETPEPGRIIGYHGKVLKSLQLLAQNYLHDRYSRHFSVSINVHDYLEHRTGTLIELATKAAHRVLETGQNYRMDPMTNSERKIIHKTVSRIAGVESYSEGDDPDRYVVIVSRD